MLPVASKALYGRRTGMATKSRLRIVQARPTLELLEERNLLWNLVDAFGTSGHQFISSFQGQALAVAFQSTLTGDYIVIGGYMKCESSPGAGVCDSDGVGGVNPHGNADWAMIRLDATTGEPDDDFGSNGIATLDWDNDNFFETSSLSDHTERINAIAIDGDNRILAAGYVFADGNDFPFTGAPQNAMVMRFTEDGDLDTSGSPPFGNVAAGMNIIGFWEESADCSFFRANVLTDIIIDPTTQYITVSGWSSNMSFTTQYFAIARLLPNGGSDVDFAEDYGCTVEETEPPTRIRGMRLIGFTSDAQANALIQTEDGEYVLVGFSRPTGGTVDFTIVKLTEDGEFAGGFGSGGIKTIDFGSTADVANDVVLQTVGQEDYIVIAGTSGNNFGLARLFLSDGLLDDDDFGGNGTATGLISYDYDDDTAGSGDGTDRGTSVLLHDNNTIVVSGYTDPTGSNPDFFSGARFGENGDESEPNCNPTIFDCVFRSTFTGTLQDQAFDMVRDPNTGNTFVVGFHSSAAGVHRMAAISLCPDPEDDCNTPSPISSDGSVRPDAVAAYAVPVLAQQARPLIETSFPPPSASLRLDSESAEVPFDNPIDPHVAGNVRYATAVHFAGDFVWAELKLDWI